MHRLDEYQDVEAEEVQSLDQATRVVGAPCLPKDTSSTRQFWVCPVMFGCFYGGC